MSEEYPLVSAITLVGKERLDDILKCIECFKSQTYPYKELIIINNASSQLKASELNIKAERDIFLFDTPTEMTAGMARAQGMSIANGQLIAQFDVDWWHAPERLQIQIATLAQQNAHISLLTHCLSYSYLSGGARYFKNERNAILGTMVHIRQKEVNYSPNNEKNEELVFLEALIDQGNRPISIMQPELCCKLHLTNDSRITDANNVDLEDNHFQIVHNLVKINSSDLA